MVKIKLGLAPAFLHHLPKLSQGAFSLWLSPTWPQANAKICNTYHEFHDTKSITSWTATALTYFELEYTNKIIINVPSGHLRGHSAMKFACGRRQPFCFLVYLAAEA